mmetsp:Transcript_8273/g.24875  ORF Transcript_8273/g.24875 Transcript_8273/m.24875 type:complete len:405 (+) Transcript_8273:625-1839(+)
MEADQLQIPQIAVRGDLFGGDEGGIFGVHVGLIDLVGEEHYPVIGAELRDDAHVLVRHDVAGGVSRIDHGHGAHVQSVPPGLGQFSLQFFSRYRPIQRFVQIVSHLSPSQFRDEGRIDGILRYGDHDRIVVVGEQSLQHHRYAVRRAVGQEDVAGIGRTFSSVSCRYVFGDVFPKTQNALRMGVRAGAARSDDGSIFSCAVHHVPWKEFGHLGMIDPHFGGQIAQCHYLTIVRNGTLTDLMRIANVGVEYLPTFGGDGVGSHDHLAAYGVLHTTEGLTHGLLVPRVAGSSSRIVVVFVLLLLRSARILLISAGGLGLGLGRGPPPLLSGTPPRILRMQLQHSRILKIGAHFGRRHQPFFEFSRIVLPPLRQFLPPLQSIPRVRHDLSRIDVRSVRGGTHRLDHE